MSGARGHVRAGHLAPRLEPRHRDQGGRVPAGGNRGVSAFSSQPGLRALPQPYVSLDSVIVAEGASSGGSTGAPGGTVGRSKTNLLASMVEMP